MKKFVSAVLVVIFAGLLVSSCGGKGAKTIRTAPRDLVNSVRNQLTGNGGKTVSSGPLFGRRAYAVPPFPLGANQPPRQVKIPVVLVQLYDSHQLVDHYLHPQAANVSVRGYYSSLFSVFGEDWRNPFQPSWLGSGLGLADGFSLRDYYRHNSFQQFDVTGDIITAGQQQSPPPPPTSCNWFNVPNQWYDRFNGNNVYYPTDYDALMWNLQGQPGALPVVSLYFRSGRNLPLTDPRVCEVRAFLNSIIDWLNLTSVNGNPPPFLNHENLTLSPARDFPDSPSLSTATTFDSQDWYLWGMGPNWTYASGDRTPGQPWTPFFSGFEPTWLDNFDANAVFQDPAYPSRPIFDNLTIVVAGPRLNDYVREAVIPIASDWQVDKLHYIDPQTGEPVDKQLGTVTLLFERDYNPYIFCHEFGHVIGLPDLYDQRNGLDDAADLPGLVPLHGDNGIGNKSLMGDEMGLNLSDSNTRYNSSNNSLDQYNGFGRTSTTNDLDCYSRFVCGWIPSTQSNPSTNKVHILTMLPSENPAFNTQVYNLAPGNALLQVPIPLINKPCQGEPSGGHFYAIPMVPLWRDAQVWPSQVYDLPHGFGLEYEPALPPNGAPWPEWLLLEYRGPDPAHPIYDQFLAWNSSSTSGLGSSVQGTKGLLIWHLDANEAYYDTGGELGTQSAYNMGSITTCPGNPGGVSDYKFLRLLEADGAKEDPSADPVQYVLGKRLDSSDARYGDMYDIWGYKGDGSEDFTASNNWRQLPYLTPYNSGLPWWTDLNWADFKDPQFKYVNSQFNYDPGGSTTTGLLVRNFRKSGQGNTVYPSGGVTVYPAGSGWPYVVSGQYIPDQVGGDSSIMFVDIFRLPSDESGNLIETNAVKILSLSGVQEGSLLWQPGTSIHVHTYAANSFDNSAGAIAELLYSEHSNGQWGSWNSAGTYQVSAGHGVADFDWTPTPGIQTDEINIEVTFHTTSQPTDAVDVLTNYFATAIQVPQVHYGYEVQNQIFNNYCTSCHSGSTPPGGLDLSVGVSWYNLVNVYSVGNPSEYRVTPSNDTDSYLWNLVSTNDVRYLMPPPTSPQLTQSQKTTIDNWILQGALNN